MNKSVAFHTFGCKLNFSETSTLTRQFEKQGYTLKKSGEPADIYIINTCSVTENADKKCKQLVNKIKNLNANTFIAVTGCFAQLQPQQIAQTLKVDLVSGAAEKFDLLAIIEKKLELKEDSCTVLVKEIAEAKDFKASYSLNQRTRTFLKVQDGCNYGCAFCTIPQARGKSRSDTIASVISNAQQIANQGVKEIVLTGVNTGDFGIRNGRRQDRFIDLIKELDKIDGLRRIRISSIEPNLLDAEIIEFVAQSNLFVPHFHIPLQSGSDTILRKMRRRYDTGLYTDRLKTIKQLMPNACIGVDVIVGFPGETDSYFNETFNYLKQSEASYLHVFTYSERPNTDAVAMAGVVPPQERNLRSQKLRNLSAKLKHNFYAEQLGGSRPVLFEKQQHGDFMEGFTDNYIKVKAPYDANFVNTIQWAKLLEINSDQTMAIVMDKESVC